MVDLRSICLACGLVLTAVKPGHGAAADPGLQIKTVATVDAAGAPVSGARAYAYGLFQWDDQAGRARWIDTKPVLSSDRKGEFSFEHAHLRAEPYLIMDDTLERMGTFLLQRGNWTRSQTIRLAAPARIKGVFQNQHAGMSSPSVDISYFEPESRRASGHLIMVTYGFDGPVKEIPLDVACPSGCHLYLHVGADGGVRPLDREIPPLAPGQTLDLGTLELPLISGYKVLGKQAPELQAAQWLTGGPVVLAELRHKVVLLSFWGPGSDSYQESVAALTALHKKYSRDGLVIVAVHDSSGSKTSLPSPQIPFAVAVDSPVSVDVPAGDRKAGGSTIEAYGITSFPTLLLINKGGPVEGTESVALENRIHQLLYGRPLLQPTAGARLMAAGRRQFIAMGVAGGLILALASVFLLLASRNH